MGLGESGHSYYCAATVLRVLQCMLWVIAVDYGVEYYSAV
jgi:hypothetical protein